MGTEITSKFYWDHYENNKPYPYTTWEIPVYDKNTDKKVDFVLVTSGIGFYGSDPHAFY